ncbi:MAG TPA: PASTA domain-containing protein [Solirubrobacteraceae bacterium]|nr:PASTA domain-containing protein [Solirubrobacteraceae bacterium]
MRSERRRVTRWVPVLIWAGILTGVLALIAISSRPGAHEVGRAMSLGPQGPVVPEVQRLSVPDARAALERAGFWVRVAREPSSTVRVGRVIGTTPASATPLRVGAQVTLLVSSGRPRVRVPALEGLSRSTAEEKALAAGLRVVVVRRESPEPPGVVIGQSPDAGQRVRAQRIVRIAVAARPAPVEVPDVTGTGFEAAVTSVSGASLTVDFAHRRVRRSGDVGRVLSQSPAGGATVARGARVTLTIGVRR